MQFATKEVARGMANPTVSDWGRLKHLVRYRIGSPKVVQCFEWQDRPTRITCFADSDWAGCRETRKSTSGGGVVVGSHTLKTWSRTQSTVAISSGEAELYAAVKGAAELLGLQSLARDLGFQMGAELRVDARATIGMVHRQGLGKMRHIVVGHLWIQDAVKLGRIKVSKVLGADNIADTFAKYLDQSTIRRHLEEMRFEFVD
jgi:hypothetical protein